MVVHKRLRKSDRMCGRFTQRFTWREVHEMLNLTGPAENLEPRYNVASGQQVTAARSGPTAAADASP